MCLAGTGVGLNTLKSKQLTNVKNIMEVLSIRVHFERDGNLSVSGYYWLQFSFFVVGHNLSNFAKMEQSLSLLGFKCRSFTLSQCLPWSSELCLVSAFEKDIDNSIWLEWSSFCICSSNYKCAPKPSDQYLSYISLQIG